jgi:hypothetical protein
MSATYQLNRWRNYEWPDRLKHRTVGTGLCGRRQTAKRIPTFPTILQVPGELAVSDFEQAKATSVTFGVQCQQANERSGPAVMERFNVMLAYN